MVSLKAVVAALAAWATLGQAAPVESHEESPALSPRASYASTSGLLFNIDGTVKYFAGTNSYWIGFLTNNADVDLVMSHLQTAGLKVLRVWGFNDVSNTNNGVWYQSFVPGQAPQINTGANGLQRLDYVVTSAAAHGIKLVINFVNNWGDYGGMPMYNTYYGTNKTTWYTTAAVQAQYKAYIAAVVSRYKTSTAVFAWELANEPRCNGCPTSILTNWATSTSAYIKSLDPNHMVTLGDEGFMNGGGDGSYPYTASEGVDFVANLKIPNLDYGTFHLYPSSWGESNPWGNPWITNHAAACVAAGKPCVLEEYGSTSDQVNVESQWQATALSSAGIAGDQFWQFGDTLSNGQTANDGYTIYYGTAAWTSLITDHVLAINNGVPPPPPPSSTTSAHPTSTPTSATHPPTTTSVKPSTSKTSSAPASSSTSGGSGGGATSPHWGQCAGNGYTGPTVCASPWTCVYSNAWYSQCL